MIEESMFCLGEEKLSKASLEFADARRKPFSHTVVQGLLEPKFADLCAIDFEGLSDEGFVRYADPDFEFDKYALNKIDLMPQSLRSLFNSLHSQEFINKIERITGFKGLMVDKERWGGGLHRTLPGGYLAVHKDFSVLPTTFRSSRQLLRTVNIIGYLTKEWEASWGGELELWNATGERCEKRLLPHFNSWVIFDTRGSFHGHPMPFQGKKPRMSIAAYYYLEQEVPRESWHSTHYLRLPWKAESAEYATKRRERASAELRYKSLL